MMTDIRDKLACLNTVPNASEVHWLNLPVAINCSIRKVSIFDFSESLLIN